MLGVLSRRRSNRAQSVEIASAASEVDAFSALDADSGHEVVATEAVDEEGHSTPGVVSPSDPHERHPAALPELWPFVK